MSDSPHYMTVENNEGDMTDRLEELPQPRPPGTRGQELPGSRPPGTATSQYSTSRFRQTWSSIAPSLQILSPTDLNQQEMMDLDIESFGSGGEDLTDDGSDQGDSDGGGVLQVPGRELTQASSLFHVGDPGKLRTDGGLTQPNTARTGELWEADSDMASSRQISLLEKEAAGESDVDSDEERGIMAEIRAEITAQVRTEMVDELAGMKRHIQGGRTDRKDDDLDNLDPDLRLAILKMRKLDRILAKKEDRERKVKRDRILLQARLKKELADIKPDGRDDIKEVQNNTSKYLALTLPPSHNMGMRITERGELEEDTTPVTPVFTTQVPDDSNSARNTKLSENSSSVHESSTSNHMSSSSANTSTGTGSGQGRKGSKSRRRNKDFIKRNIQLAADAGESVAMTDDEKRRIQSLLADLDSVPEGRDSDTLQADHPYAILLTVDEGFHPSKPEIERLEAIDRRLMSLMAPQDYESIASTPSTLQQQSPLFTRTAIDIDAPGEPALQETKEHRSLAARLRAVEGQLAQLTHAARDQHSQAERFDIDKLVDDCVKSMSNQRETPSEQLSTTGSDCVDMVSSRLSLLSHPPSLPRTVLDKLLEEARESQQHQYESETISPSTIRAIPDTPDTESHDLHITLPSTHYVIESIDESLHVPAAETDQQTLLSQALAAVEGHFPTDTPSVESRASTAGDTEPSETPMLDESTDRHNNSSRYDSKHVLINKSASNTSQVNGELGDTKKGQTSIKTSLLDRIEYSPSPDSDGYTQPTPVSPHPQSLISTVPFLPSLDPGTASLISIHSNANSRPNSQANSRPNTTNITAKDLPRQTPVKSRSGVWGSGEGGSELTPHPPGRHIGGRESASSNS